MNYRPTIITERLNILKDLKGVKTYAEIAIATFVSATSISNWIKGKSEPSPFNIIKLACYFDTTYEYITGQTDEINAPILPKSAELIGVTQFIDFNIHSITEIDKLPTKKLINCYITSEFDRFIYSTDNKIRFQLPNYFKED